MLIKLWVKAVLMWILSEAMGSGKQGVILVSPSAASPGSPLASALGKQRGWRLHAVVWVLRCITSFRVHPAKCKMRSLTWSHAVWAASWGLGNDARAHLVTCSPGSLGGWGNDTQAHLSTSSLSVTNLRPCTQVNLQSVWCSWSLQGCSPDPLTFLWAQK